MCYIRAVVTIIWVVLVCLIGAPLYFLTWLIGKANKKRMDRIRYSYVHNALKVVWVLAGGKMTVKGLENIPKDRAVLFISNHRSIFDIVATGMQIPYPTGYVAKIELAKIPLLNLQMKAIGCLFLDREDVKQGLKTILQAISQVKEGRSMFIFPEGTRSKVEGQMGEFHAGSFKIATKAKAPIVPVTIVGSGDLLEDHFPKLKRAHVIVEYGKPIETASMDRKAQADLPDEVKKIIEDTYQKNAELV